MRGLGRALLAATLLCIAGTLNIIYGIGALDNAHIFVNDKRFIFTDLNTMGWVLIILGVVQLTGGFSLMVGHTYGRIIGLVAGSLGAIAALLSIVGADAGRHHVGRPAPRHRRVAQQREQRQRGGHERAAERRAGPRLTQPAAQRAVQEPEGRPVAPAQGQAEVAILARGDVREVHHGRHDLPGHERVVVVELALVSGAHAPLARVGQRQRRRAGGPGEHAADRPRGCGHGSGAGRGWAVSSTRLRRTSVNRSTIEGTTRATAAADTISSAVSVAPGAAASAIVSCSGRR